MANYYKGAERLLGVGLLQYNSGDLIMEKIIFGSERNIHQSIFLRGNLIRAIQTPSCSYCLMQLPLSLHSLRQEGTHAESDFRKSNSFFHFL